MEVCVPNRGRKERLNNDTRMPFPHLSGAMGVRMVQGTEGAIRLPPADMLYAVEPEGVAMMRPSASTVWWWWGGRSEKWEGGDEEAVWGWRGGEDGVAIMRPSASTVWWWDLR